MKMHAFSSGRPDENYHTVFMNCANEQTEGNQHKTYLGLCLDTMHMASPLQKKYLALSCLLLFLLFLIPGYPVSGDVIKPSRYSANTVRGYNESDPGIYDQNHQFLVSSGQNQSNTDTMAGINTTIIPANSSQIKLLQSAWIRKDAATLTHFLNQAAKAAGISSLFTSTMILPDEVVL